MTIKIIEHRAGWCKDINNYDDKTLQNSESAFRKSFERGNGVETDLRDNNGKIVISHDLPSGDELSFEEFLTIYNEYTEAGTLALNIKADGLQSQIKKLLNKYKTTDYFLFDMSIPDSLGYIRENLNTYIRDSEFELEPENFSPSFYASAKGVWLDQFNPGKDEPSRITYNLIKKHLEADKAICIVSPELHPWGRTKNSSYKNSWAGYKENFTKLTSDGFDTNNISICTDLPVEADNFFNN